jgi:hypothetical protein
MKVKITESILDYDGKPLKENEIKLSKQLVGEFRAMVSGKTTTTELCFEFLEKEIQKEPLTYRVVINNALNSPLLKEDGKAEIISAGDKAKCYEITKKIFASKEVDVTPSQIAFICEKVDKVYLSPILYGRVCEFFGNLKDGK